MEDQEKYKEYIANSIKKFYDEQDGGFQIGIEPDISQTHIPNFKREFKLTGGNSISYLTTTPNNQLTTGSTITYNYPYNSNLAITGSVISNIVTKNEFLELQITVLDQQSQINVLTKAIEALLETKIKENNE